MVGEISTNFRMPQVYSIGLGGGTVVNIDEVNKSIDFGASIAYEIHSRAKIFGGDILTATDIAVACGLFKKHFGYSFP